MTSIHNFVLLQAFASERPPYRPERRCAPSPARGGGLGWGCPTRTPSSEIHVIAEPSAPGDQIALRVAGFGLPDSTVHGVVFVNHANRFT